MVRGFGTGPRTDQSKVSAAAFPNEKNKSGTNFSSGFDSANGGRYFWGGSEGGRGVSSEICSSPSCR